MPVWQQVKFEEEAMDPATLIEVLEQQGKKALDQAPHSLSLPPLSSLHISPPSQALKELGIKSMGHRLKIINAMLIV